VSVNRVGLMINSLSEGNYYLSISHLPIYPFIIVPTSHLSISYLPIFVYLQSFIVSGFGQSGLPAGHLIKNGIGTSVQYEISLSSL